MEAPSEGGQGCTDLLAPRSTVVSLRQATRTRAAASTWTHVASSTPQPTRQGCRLAPRTSQDTPGHCFPCPVQRACYNTAATPARPRSHSQALPARRSHGDNVTAARQTPATGHQLSPAGDAEVGRPTQVERLLKRRNCTDPKVHSISKLLSFADSKL